MIAPWIVDAPMNGRRFEVWIETQLAPELKPGDVVVLDKCRLPQERSRRRTGAPAQRVDAVPAAILPGPQPDRDGPSTDRHLANFRGCPTFPHSRVIERS
jgi:hypothetical protein